MTGIIYASDLALQKQASDENQYMKTLYAVAMNTGDGKVYVSQGTTPTAHWKCIDGVTADIVPAEMTETGNLQARWTALGTPRTMTTGQRAAIDRWFFIQGDCGLLAGAIYQHLLGGPYQNAAVLSLLPACVSGTNYDGTEVGAPPWVALNSAGGGYTFGAGQTVTIPYSMFAGPAEGATATAFCIFGFNMTASAFNGYDHKAANIKAKQRLRNTSGARIAMGGTTELGAPATASSGPHFMAADVTGAVQRIWDEGLLAISGATGGTGAPDLMQYGDAVATGRQLWIGGAYNFAPSAAQHKILRDGAYELARALGVSI